MSTPGRNVIFLLLMGFLQGCSHKGDDAAPQSWQQVMLALQENLVRKPGDSLSGGMAPVQAGPWYCTRPVDDVTVEEKWSDPKFDFRCFTEGRSASILFRDKPDLTAKDAGGKAVWQEIQDFRDGIMHPWQKNEMHTIYLYRAIFVPVAATVTGVFRAAGYFVTPEMQAWLNGRQVLEKSPVGDRYPYEEVDLNLVPGVNHLVIRAHNLYMFGFNFSTGPLAAGSLFWNQLRRQFPDSSSREEMKREMTSGIWNELLGPDHTENIKILARRYSKACPGRGYAGKLAGLAEKVATDDDLFRIRKLYHLSHDADKWLDIIRNADFNLLRPDSTRARQLQRQRDSILNIIAEGHEDRLEPAQLEKLASELGALRREAICAMVGADEIVFVQRHRARGYNWYGDVSFFMKSPAVKMYCRGGSQLCRLNLHTGMVTNILDDPDGAFRDPQVGYDGKKVLFSWRRGGTEYYHLYEANLDGTGLVQITDGPYDDIEGIYLPAGGLVFSSTRCNRWVACGPYRTSILYSCNAEGKNIRPLSSNIVSENTPWMLPDGRVMFMRWEYVDRNQMRYQHLWTINPDGTGVMVLYGNQFPNNVFIDAKPVPGGDKIVFVDIPFHGMEDRRGTLKMLDPKYGPDERAAAKPLDLGTLVSQPGQSMDPYPLGENLFLFVNDRKIFLTDGCGNTYPLYSLPEDSHPNLMIQEPRPVVPRKREKIIPDRIDPARATGRLALMDVNYGRNMAGVLPGEVRKLLILEQLPKPLNASGGPAPTSMGGTFTLKRILGTIPVEADGSAYMELPALRSLFFVALDENDLSVKRMQSFVTLQPGEFTSCSGCHEKRTTTPKRPANGEPMAFRKPISQIDRIPDIPEIFDYPRDIQPILDRHCIACHDYTPTAMGGPRAGGIILTGDHGPVFSHSYASLTLDHQFADGRNDSGDKPPRAIGTSASPLMKKIDGSHHQVSLSPHEREMIRYWIEAGANYIGTSAAMCDGWVKVEADTLIRYNCNACHAKDLNDKLNPELIYNLSRPEKSLALLAPLTKEKGGYGICQNKEGKPVFSTNGDKAYQLLFSSISTASLNLKRVKRFDMPGYRPIDIYFQLMKEYGLLPEKFDPATDYIDYNQMDEKYWRSFWYQPVMDNDKIRN